MTGALPWSGGDARKLGQQGGQAGAAATSLLVLFSYAFRLPALLNAPSTNSDAAVVGLQAIHILRGERSPFLWGSGYQTSADAFVAAGWFAAIGPTPFALMVSALTLHVLATLLVFATLRRCFRPWTSLLLSLPLVFAPSSIHTYALYPPRQLSITLAIAALWAIDAAVHRPRRATGWLTLGGLLYGLAVSADPYPMVLAPIVLGYGAIVALRRPGARVPAFTLATVTGLVPFALIHLTTGAKSGPLGLSTSVFAHNWELLVRECLPWALSYKVYRATNVMDYRPWEPPIAVNAVQLTGAIVAGAIVAAGVAAVFSKKIPTPIRRLGFFGAMTYPVAIGAFLLSVMVMDHFSMRYLAVLTIMLPFAAMPAARLLGGPRLAILLAPHLVASALCGWVGYGPFVRGLVPVLGTPELRDDYALLDLLRSRGIAHAEADYWAAYRLTFLYGEQVVVVPTNPNEDRYPPYRGAFEAAPVFAYVFDPGRSREDLAQAEASLVRSNASVERTQAGRHTVFVVSRADAIPSRP